MTTTEMVPTGGNALAAGPTMTIEGIIAQKKLVAQCVSELMKEGEHFGVIPGTEKKDSNGRDISKRVLFKAGADMLCSLFQLVADYETLEAVRTPALIYYRLKCTLTSASSGIRRGSGLGSCNSNEEKYLRAAPKKCPNCSKETIFRSKQANRDGSEPGWYCWNKKGGCGANFAATDPAIVDQDTGVKDPADLDNTILKMAAKRSRVDAILTVTGASDFFTQDVEDLTEREAEYIPPKASAEGKAEDPAPREYSTTGSPTTAKLPTADTIKHDGKFITHEQLKKLHVTRKQAGGSYCTDEDDPKSLWRMKVLGVYRDQRGQRISSSKQLSVAQASHLIERLTGYIAKTNANVKPLDIPAANGASDVLASQIKDKGLSQTDVTEYVLAPFGADSVDELEEDDKPKALALVLAYTQGYEPYCAAMRKLGFKTDHLL